jgi:hypothetical protein
MEVVDGEPHIRWQGVLKNDIIEVRNLCLLVGDWMTFRWQKYAGID